MPPVVSGSLSSSSHACRSNNWGCSYANWCCTVKSESCFEVEHKRSPKGQYEPYLHAQEPFDLTLRSSLPYCRQSRLVALCWHQSCCHKALSISTILSPFQIKADLLILGMSSACWSRYIEFVLLEVVVDTGSQMLRTWQWCSAAQLERLPQHWIELELRPVWYRRRQKPLDKALVQELGNTQQWTANS